MAYFFFGTLMDREVLERVLDRPVQDHELAPATLDGYRRVRAAGAAYPLLVPDPPGEVRGVLLRPVSGRDAARIRHFEDEEYVERPMLVRLRREGTVLARVFFALPALGQTDRPWDLATWTREHKQIFLLRCDEWMRDCP